MESGICFFPVSDGTGFFDGLHLPSACLSQEKTAEVLACTAGVPRQHVGSVKESQHP